MRTEWNFDFGFVIPDSTNSWESTVVADQGNMLPAHVLKYSSSSPHPCAPAGPFGCGLRFVVMVCGLSVCMRACSGNVIIVTTFYDEGKPMDSCSIRVFYDEEDATSAASV